MIVSPTAASATSLIAGGQEAHFARADGFVDDLPASVVNTPTRIDRMRRFCQSPSSGLRWPLRTTPSITRTRINNAQIADRTKRSTSIEPSAVRRDHACAWRLAGGATMASSTFVDPHRRIFADTLRMAT